MRLRPRPSSVSVRPYQPPRADRGKFYRLSRALRALELRLGVSAPRAANLRGFFASQMLLCRSALRGERIRRDAHHGRVRERSWHCSCSCAPLYYYVVIDWSSLLTKTIIAPLTQPRRIFLAVCGVRWAPACYYYPTITNSRAHCTNPRLSVFCSSVCVS